MSKRKRLSRSRIMLEMWRPPHDAGDPVGCLATTFTFSPGLFDEQCLARFLEIESEPDREDLAFLLERESRLGSVYAGVLADHTRAGVEHSLRWDVLPVRIHAGKQHAKLSLLVWTRSIRIIVASANLTEPGYRTNREVAAAIDLQPEASNPDVLAAAIEFLRSLLSLVPGSSDRLPEVERAEAFLKTVAIQTEKWKSSRRGETVRQRLVCTLPERPGGGPAQSSLEDAIHECRRRGGSPSEAWIASPFFDADEGTSRVTASLCKGLARGGDRTVCFCVPASIEGGTAAVPRLAAPKALLNTPPNYQSDVFVDVLPQLDGDRNRRPWHAKMLALRASGYSALMIGSSNFTCAGMGVASHRNSEANLLTIADRVAYGRETAELESIWREMEPVDDPESAEWLGGQPDQEEEEQSQAPSLPLGFLSATYHAGDARRIVLRFEPAHLPEEWTIRSCGPGDQELLSATQWHELGGPTSVDIAWTPVQPPEKLLVRWEEKEAFLALNVQDSRNLPPPSQLDCMSADDMLLILAAADPSAAFRVWAKQRQASESFDSDLDAATPIDLDPLRRYDLQATFLHRVRRRARILAQLRANLDRPVHTRQALEWRLRGMVGIEPLADRLLRDFLTADGKADEALLTLADFVIMLREVDYKPGDGSLPKVEFEGVFRPFLAQLAGRLRDHIEPLREQVSADLMGFWERVVDKCRG